MQVELKNLTKVFGSVVANNDISLDFRPGTIYGLIGENGAGKTTLMNLIYGVHQPDMGEIRIDNQAVKMSSPRLAIQLGIGMVHQHFMLVPSLTVAENVILGQSREKLFLNIDKVRKEIIELSRKYGMDCDPDARVDTLSVGLKQRVEIIKALYKGSRFLILDEPTSVLTPQEITELFQILKSLKHEGNTIILVTHKLNEIKGVTDRIIVMRKGCLVGEVETVTTDEAAMAKMMVGRDVLFRVEKADSVPGEAALVIKNLYVNCDRNMNAVNGLSLDVRCGEIVGIAGVEGNGQSELVECIAGYRKPAGGVIHYYAEDITGYSPRQRRETGISHIPEDRMSRGVNGNTDIKDNLIAGMHYSPPFSYYSFLHERNIAAWCRELVERFGIVAADVKKNISTLSGGNIQKVVVAREMQGKTKVLIAAQPTRGVDIGAIEFIHRKIIELRDQGAAILLVSSELSEITSLSDRVLVMFKGTITGELTGNKVSEENIGVLMTGFKEKAQ